MPRRKFIDKKTATTFTLVHRAQNDPLIHDDNAPSMVFTEKQAPHQHAEEYDDSVSLAGSSVSRSRKIKQRGDLEEEFGFSVRQNEGEAAQHGVFYDDSAYDYMQHMRDLGAGEGAVTWVDSSAQVQEKKTGKQRLEDALRDMDLETQSVGASSMASSSARSLLPEEVLPSEYAMKRSYQDQQDVPDEIAGFQPDMDPRLREVLEALEDEEYVDDEDDIFGELTKQGEEVDRDEWERLGEQDMFEEEDAGWESDDTIKAASSQPTNSAKSVRDSDGDGIPAAPPENVQGQPPADPTGGAWLDEYKKFKTSEKSTAADTTTTPAPAPSTLESSALSSLATGRRKKRRGAKTSTTSYSMTSSALLRTDQQTLLDARFDTAIDKEDAAMDEFADDEFADSASLASGMSRVSNISRYSNLSRTSGVSSYSRASDAEAPQLQRTDFDGIMDEFLGTYSKTGKAGRRVRRGAPMSGMEQLDEIRNGLGPARVKSAARAS